MSVIANPANRKRQETKRNTFDRLVRESRLIAANEQLAAVTAERENLRIENAQLKLTLKEGGATQLIRSIIWAYRKWFESGVDKAIVHAMQKAEDFLK
jgi:hypothetical protein